MSICKIYLVDDHPVYLEGLKNVLQKSSAVEVVGCASDGAEALKYLESNQPDIIFIDVGLPILNGVDLIKQLRFFNHPSKIVVLTQLFDEKTIREIIKLNVNGFILKSDGLSEIENSIEAVKKGQTYFGQEVSHRIYQINQSNQNTKSIAKDLSEREKEVVVLISKGKSVRDIASSLGCSENTIKSHKSNIMRKISVSNSAGISAWAFKSGLVE